MVRQKLEENLLTIAQRTAKQWWQQLQKPLPYSAGLDVTSLRAARGTGFSTSWHRVVTSAAVLLPLQCALPVCQTAGHSAGATSGNGLLLGADANRIRRIFGLITISTILYTIGCADPRTRSSQPLAVPPPAPWGGNRCRRRCREPGMWAWR